MFMSLNVQVDPLSHQLIQDARKLETLLKGGEVSHPLGRRWTLELALAACGDPSECHKEPVEDKDCRIILSWIPLNVSGDVHNPHGPWSKLTVWEVRFLTKDVGRVLWKKRVGSPGSFIIAGPDYLSQRTQGWAEHYTSRHKLLGCAHLVVANGRTPLISRRG
jgi:hypothetical protein